MPGTSPIDHVPLWLLFIAIAVMVAISIEAGYRIGRYRSRHSKDERESPVGAIVGASLGLLGFILAFTFGLAASRFDERRRIVVQEANAIGTTYLRAGLLPGDSTKSIRKLLEEYTDARLEVTKTRDIPLLMQRSEELHEKLWKEGERVGNGNPQSIVVGLFLESLNETIDVHAERVLIAVRNRLPTAIWISLFFVTVITMGGVGYHEGLSKSRRSPAILVLVFSFSLVITLISDLDRPQDGYLRVSQEAMIELQRMIQQHP
ncbi:MAG: hypothetical protein MUF23_16995 [Pirellula sp.]|nr:hypothetical protein [Pirellula sp.]